MTGKEKKDLTQRVMDSVRVFAAILKENDLAIGVTPDNKEEIMLVDLKTREFRSFNPKELNSMMYPEVTIKYDSNSKKDN